MVTPVGAAEIAIDNTHEPTPFTVDGTLIQVHTGMVAVGASPFSLPQLESIDEAPERDEFARSFVPFGDSVPMTDLMFPNGSLIHGVVEHTFVSPIPPGSSLIGQNILVVIGNGSSIESSTHLAIVRSATAFGADNPLFNSTLHIKHGLRPGADLVVGTRIQGVEVPPEFAGPFPGIALATIHQHPPATALEPIASIKRTPAGMRLEIPIAHRRVIGIQYSPDAARGTWIELGNFFAEGDEMASFLDPDFTRLARRRGFYRAFLRPQIE